ncbi:uncharacterized protein [Watersipora subatra]|uniref:uncharacterized protein n=1 Tax=Watersipora subatra TaxID=2589382 RepID=UPI00355C19FB
MSTTSTELDDSQESSSVCEPVIDQDDNDCRTTNEFDAKTAASVSVYSKSTLRKVKNLVQISLRGEETVESISQQASSMSETGCPSARMKSHSKNDSVFSFSKKGMVKNTFQANEVTPTLAGKSGLEDTPTEDISDIDEKQMLQLMGNGLRVNAREALKNMMEIVMSVAIVQRCTNSDEVMDVTEAQKRLENFGVTLDQTQKPLLGLIYDAENLNEIATRLDYQYLSFDEIRRKFLKAVENVDNGISYLNKQEKNADQKISLYYSEAVQFYNEHREELIQNAKNGDDQITEENHKLLKSACKKLKLGVMHELVRRMDIGLRRLAKGELNGFIFYPEEEEAELKARPYPPFEAPGTKGVEDIVDAIENPRMPDGENSKTIKELFDNWSTLTNVYLSSYVPELAENGLCKSKPADDYFECDISLATKLFTKDKKTQKPRAMSLYGKFKGVLKDNKCLKQDKGYLNEEIERLRQETDDLRAQLKVSKQTSLHVSCEQDSDSDDDAIEFEWIPGSSDE